MKQPTQATPTYLRRVVERVFDDGSSTRMAVTERLDLPHASVPSEIDAHP